MKRLFVLLTFIGSSFFTSAYAADSNPVVVQAFQTTFATAKDIQWAQVGVLSKATFELDGHYRSAFYNSDGDLIAVTQNLSSDMLPKLLQAGVKKELQGRWITDAFVVNVEGAATYYVTLENADTKVMLKSAGAKKWTVYQKDDK